jgi:hypothetical protein
MDGVVCFLVVCCQLCIQSHVWIRDSRKFSIFACSCCCFFVSCLYLFSCLVLCTYDTTKTTKINDLLCFSFFSPYPRIFLPKKGTKKPNELKLFLFLFFLIERKRDREKKKRDEIIVEWFVRSKKNERKKERIYILIFLLILIDVKHEFGHAARTLSMSLSHSSPEREASPNSNK